MSNIEIKVNNKNKKTFNAIFYLLKNLSNQINLSINKNELHIQGMDISHVILFDLKLSKEWFEEYKLNEDEYKFSLDSNIFYSVITTKNEEQTLIIKLVEDDILNIELINNNKNNDLNKFFKIPLIDYDYHELTIQENEYDADVTIYSKKIADVLDELSNFGDNVLISFFENYINFETKGDSCEMIVNIEINNMVSYSIIEDKTFQITYNLSYLNKLCTNKLTNEIDFSFSNDLPLKIRYDLGENSSLVFFIASKIN